MEHTGRVERYHVREVLPCEGTLMLSAWSHLIPVSLTGETDPPGKRPIQLMLNWPNIAGILGHKGQQINELDGGYFK
jgi:hypothetical protein